jgi:hypothetical protein
VIDLREAQVFVGKVAQLRQRLLDANPSV